MEVNGFFNRITSCRWVLCAVMGVLSGPILNRGVIAWDEDSALQFGRLRLDQDLWWWKTPLELRFLNSGYVQKGLSRYTRAWGPCTALSGEEQALLVRDASKPFMHPPHCVGGFRWRRKRILVARGVRSCQLNPDKAAAASQQQAREASNVLEVAPCCCSRVRWCSTAAGKDSVRGF